MAAYRRVYDSHHLQADCEEPGSAPEPYARIEYGLPLPFLSADTLLRQTLAPTLNPDFTNAGDCTNNAPFANGSKLAANDVTC